MITGDVMKKLNLALIIFFSFSSVQAQDNVAVTTKTEGEISLKRAAAEQYEPGLSIGTPIRNSDWILTGGDGFGVLVFIDDKSQLKIREETEIEIQGSTEQQVAALQKDIRIGNGQVKAEIAEQRKGSLSITSSTSVAAVKGTEFWFSADSIDGDLVVVLEGLVGLTNRISGDTVDVEANQTGRSTPDGDLDVIDNIRIGGEVNQITPASSLSLANVTIIDGDTEESIEGPGPLNVVLNSYTAYETDQPTAGNDVLITGYIDEAGGFIGLSIEVVETLHKLELEFEDNSGERKNLEIDYR